MENALQEKIPGCLFEGDAGMDLKQIALRGARSAKLLTMVARSAWRKSRLTILCYHSISIKDEHEAIPALYMPRSLLRKRLERLARGGYNVLALSTALQQLFKGNLPARSVVLTFDDGTRDFAEFVVPLLIEFNMPATLYLTTYYCDNQMPVFDTAVKYLLWCGRNSALEAGIAGSSQGLRLDGAPQRNIAAGTIREFATQNRLTSGDKQSLLEHIAVSIGVDFERFLASGICRIMSPGQVTSLPRPLIDVQLHTHRHRTPRNKELFLREILDNRCSVRQMIGVTPTSHFCYPSGEYYGEFLGWLQQAGVVSATTCVPGLASRSSNPLMLPRFVDTSTTSETIFESWISGAADFLPRKREHRYDERRLNTRMAGT